MSKAKEYSTRDAVKMLRDNGFVLLRNNGGHEIYERGSSRIVIPIHNRSINRMLFNRIVKENNLK